MCGLTISGCARKDFPVSQYQVDRPAQSFASCVYRDAQQRLDPAETVQQSRLDEPEEVQVTKHAAGGALVWEVDASRSTNDGALITMRYHPGLVGWDKEALTSMNACAAGTLRRAEAR